MEKQLASVKDDLITNGFAVLDDSLGSHADAIFCAVEKLRECEALRQHRFAFKSPSTGTTSVFMKPNIFEAELEDQGVRSVAPDLIGVQCVS